jgi:putative flavoprotein involved in K+ transport
MAGVSHLRPPAPDDTRGGAAKVLLSVRTPPSIVRRDSFGFPSQVLGIASMHLPVPFVDRVAAAMRRLSFPDLAELGLPAPARPYTEFRRRRVIPVVDVGLVDAVQTGQVRVVPALEGFDAGRAIFADGTRNEVDNVIAATGFRPGLEPLVGHLGALDERGSPLVHAAEQHPNAPGPTSSATRSRSAAPSATSESRRNNLPAKPPAADRRPATFLAGAGSGFRVPEGATRRGRHAG